MDAATTAALLGGGSVAGVIADQLATWAIGRRKERTTLVDYETQIAERLLGRMEAQLVGAEAKIKAAEAQLTVLSAELAATKREVAQLRADLTNRANVAAERDRLLVENAHLKSRITKLTGGTTP